jgi:tripartite-type tricarboxylate transporter receptor subunit TctC
MLRICAWLFATVAALLFAPVAGAAGAYPERPVRLLIPFPPGGGTDVLARALQDKIEAALGAQLIIDNRGGAGGTLGTALAAKAEPDGYTYLFTSASYTFQPSLYKNLPYQPLRDFKNVTMFASAPVVMAVHPSMPVKSVKEFIALAQQRPNDVLYASAGIGSNIHMTTELFNYMAKVKLVQVPYKGGGPAVIGLISGEAQVIFSTFLSMSPHIKSGRMRALAVTTKERSPVAPDLPTLHESGVVGYDKPAWFGLFAPAGVADSSINHVYQATARVLKNPDVQKRLAVEGAAAVGNTPKEFDAFVRKEIAEWGKLIETMNLKL